MISQKEMIDFLSGRKIDRIPFWPLGFFNEQTSRRLIPEELFNYDSYIYPPIDHYDFLPHSETIKCQWVLLKFANSHARKN